MTRPAKLQVNQSGAWRDMLRFDVDAVSDNSMYLFLKAAAEMVRSTGQTGTTMRIVSDEVTPKRVLSWTAKTGWKPEGNTPANAAKPVPERPKTLAGESGTAEADAAPKTLKSKGA
jgi:hypothetical protein